MTGESPIDVRPLIDVTVETPICGRRTNTTGELPCILVTFSIAMSHMHLHILYTTANFRDCINAALLNNCCSMLGSGS